MPTKLFRCIQQPAHVMLLRSARLVYAGMLIALFAGSAQAQITVTYDEYAQLPRDEQVRVFQTLSAENRALLARTQAERWLDLNRERLQANQIVVVEEVIERIEPSLYEDANTEARQAVVEETMTKLLAVLSEEDVGRGFGAGAPYIPPVDQ